MPRWLWFTPLAGVTLLLAVGVYRLGGTAADLTETDVILLAADQYRDDAARQGLDPDRATDCVARPGSGSVWITVTCVNGERRFVYQMDRAGRFIPSSSSGPET